MLTRSLQTTALFLLATAVLPLGAQTTAPAEPPAGHEHHHHEAAAAAPAVSSNQLADVPVKPSIPDVALVDQDGKRVRFYTDLVQGKVVMMNFIFTSCTTICPPMGATFAKVQKVLGERSGRDVHLISVSVDPGTDTPERLKAWSQKLGAGPGWTLVTGDREDVTKLLKALGVYTASISDHSPLVLVGNDVQGRWTRAYGLAPPTKLVELIDGMSVAQKETRP
jgi:protein SCO1